MVYKVRLIDGACTDPCGLPVCVVVDSNGETPPIELFAFKELHLLKDLIAQVEALGELGEAAACCVLFIALDDVIDAFCH